MRRFFADSFFFFAWWNERDRAHHRVAEFLALSEGRLVTTRWVLMEVADGLAATPARRQVRDLFHDLETDSSITVIEPSASLHQRGLTLYSDRPDKAWSLTDCISFVVMEDRRLSEALTGDRHFEQAGFVALLK